MMSSSTQWKPLGEESDAVDPEILCNVPGYWQWRKTARRASRSSWIPTPSRCREMSCASRLFEAGTLAFWNVDHSVASDGDPVAFADDWFIATAAGVLQLEGSSRKFKRLHGLASDGTALQHVTDLTTTDTGAGPQLWCRTAEPVGIYKFHQNQWTETKESFPHRRTREVSSKWLKFQATDAGQMEIRMSESSTDDREHMRGPQLFLDGRFRFDVVKHMVTRGDSFWLSTPAGIVQLDRSNGSIRHYAKPFGTSPDIRTLHNVKNSLFAVDAQEQVWTWEKQWRQHGFDEALLAKLREVADNPLFRCRRAAPDDYVFHFAVGDMPAVRLNDPQFPLLKAGVFAFDDLRDVWFDKDDQLLASTRMGIWNYDLRGDTRRVEPTDAHFLARLGDGTRHAAMDELGLFFTSHVSPHEATVFDACHERAFKRTIGGEWVAVDSTSVRPAQHRSIPIGGARTYEFRDDLAGCLVGQAHRGNQSAGRPSTWPANGAQPNAWAHNFSDIVSTGDAIWAPLKERLLWIRASAL